jgi:hypothetical protein
MHRCARRMAAEGYFGMRRSASLEHETSCESFFFAYLVPRLPR